MEEKDGQNNHETRQATADELDRMESYVVWVYAQGQPVVLWKRSGFITLVPESVPNYEVVFLCQGEEINHR